MGDDGSLKKLKAKSFLVGECVAKVSRFSLGVLGEGALFALRCFRVRERCQRSATVGMGSLRQAEGGGSLRFE